MTKKTIIFRDEKTELANASQFPKFYFARHFHSGLCGYDEDTILVDTAVMKKMMPSFNGKPVYVLHDGRSMEERTEDIDSADGYVVETFYNECDGWVWSKIMVKTDAGIQRIEVDGWAVSNAYSPTAWGSAGTKHNCDYDRELLGAEFTHLAIVDNPRYEDACVMTPEAFKIYQETQREQLNELTNSKEKKGFKMNFFTKTKVKESEISADTIVEIQNGKGTIEVTIEEMANALVAQKAAEKEKKNAMIKVGDESISVKELSKRYTELMNKKNSDEDEKENEDEDEDERDNEDEDDEKSNQDDEDRDNEDDEKENEDDDEKENEGEDEKSNSKKKNHFKELKNANRKKQGVRRFDTPQNKLQRGQSRYGSPE